MHVLSYFSGYPTFDSWNLSTALFVDQYMNSGLAGQRFILSGMEYCIRLLDGLRAFLLDMVQLVRYAAILVCGHDKYNHILPLVLNNLHWFRVTDRVMVFKEPRNTGNNGHG